MGDVLRGVHRLADRFDIESYLRSHAFDRLRREEWVGDCPECGKPKLCVNVDKRQWHCWVCQEYEQRYDPASGQWRARAVKGAGGVIRLICWLERCEYEDALKTLSEGALTAIEVRELPKSELVMAVLDAPLPQAIQPPEGWAPIYAPLPYMIRRGITMNDVRAYGLFWTPEGKYRNRIVFPCWERGQLVYWQARAMYEQEDCPPGYDFRKALNPPKTDGAAVSSEVLMNVEIAATHPRVAIVEGPMDCLRAGPDAVPTFGKQMTPVQIAKLIRCGVRAVDLMWDGPKEREPKGAQPEMLQLAPFLELWFDLRLVFLPWGDPADHRREDLRAMREQAALPASWLSRTARI
jgi:hypothetical protein